MDDVLRPPDVGCSVRRCSGRFPDSFPGPRLTERVCKSRRLTAIARFGDCSKAAKCVLRPFLRMFMERALHLVLHMLTLLENVLQTAPLDLDTEVFFSARKSLIEAQLAAVAEGDIVTLLANTWTQHKGTMCRGVNWERHSLEELQTIALCVGGPGLSTICRLLAEDHAGWTAGMPDLLLWRVAPGAEPIPEVSTNHQPCTNCGCNQSERGLVRNARQETGTMGHSFQLEERADTSGRGSGESCKVPSSCVRTHRKSRKHGEAKLVEVKGPRDRLSEQQRAWIWILMNAGLSVEVCKVLEETID